MTVIDKELLQDVLPVQQEDKDSARRRQEQLRSELTVILDTKYASLNRFQADRFVETMDVFVKAIDAAIDESESQANRELREAKTAIKEANTHTDWPTENDPYFKLAIAFGNVIHHLASAQHYRAISFDAVNRMSTKLLTLVQETKDAEVETQKLEAEKALTESIRNDYKEMLKELRATIADRDTAIIELTDQVRQLSKTVLGNQTAAAVSTGSSPVEAHDDIPELTADEASALKGFKAMSGRIKYLADRHSEWPDETIAVLTNATPDQVKAARAAKK